MVMRAQSTQACADEVWLGGGKARPRARRNCLWLPGRMFEEVAECWNELFTAWMKLAVATAVREVRTHA